MTYELKKIGRTWIWVAVILFLGLFAAFTESVSAENTDRAVSDWQQLQNDINNNGDMTYTLQKDYTAASTDTCLVIPKEKTITINLNGKTLDRKAEGDYFDEGVVIQVYGKLTIEDSAGGGKITGGNGTHGGAVEVYGGALTLSGGTMTANTAWDAATVMVDQGGSFSMIGGSISDNSGFASGGVCVFDGSFSMRDGEIKNNYGQFSSGLYVDGGNAVMSGGTITAANSPRSSTVSLRNTGSVFEFSGGTIARNVYSESEKGSIEVDSGTFKLSGNPIVRSTNCADVSLAQDKCITISGQLNEDLSMSVLTKEVPVEGEPVIITDSLKNKGDIFNFYSFSEYGVGENNDGEAVFGVPVCDIIYQPGDGVGDNVSMKGIQNYKYTLWENMFTPPETKDFIGWIFWSNPTIHPPGDSFTLNSTKKLTAQYAHIVHDWVEPEYTWSTDLSSVTAERTCTLGGEKETETVSVSTAISKPTCTAKGKKTYTSEAFANDAFSVQTKTEDIKATGHKWGDWKIVKNPTAFSAGLKKRVCTNDPSHVQEQKLSATGIQGTLIAQMTTSGSKNLVIKWPKITGADGYEIYLARCNEGKKPIAFQKVKTIKGNRTLSWSKTGLKKKTAYKAYVKAYAFKSGNIVYVRTSPTMHAFTTGYKKKETNAKAVTVKQTSVSLKVGMTYTIKANVSKQKKKKRLMSKRHAPKLRYLTSNVKVATVTGGGRITAKAKGTCWVYVYAHNGVSKGVKVTVH